MEDSRRQQEQAQFVRAVIEALKDDDATAARFRQGLLSPHEVATVASELWWGRTSERENRLVAILKAQNFLLKIMIGDLEHDEEEEVEGG